MCSTDDGSECNCRCCCRVRQTTVVIGPLCKFHIAGRELEIQTPATIQSRWLQAKTYSSLSSSPSTLSHQNGVPRAASTQNRARTLMPTHEPTVTVTDAPEALNGMQSSDH